MPYLYRRNTVLEALRANRRQLHRLWLQQDLPDDLSRPLTAEANARGVPITYAGRNRLGNMVQDGSHQGVVLEVGPYPYNDLNEILAHAANQGQRPFLLLLDLLHGPHNIGSLLRTAEICGVHGVIMQDRRAPDITTAVSIYSAGAAEHLRVAQVTNLVHSMHLLKERDVWLVGLDLHEDAQDMREIDLDMPLGLVVGHEGEGMRRLVRETCDLLMTLPMRGRVASLNAAVAGAIALYQAWQARDFEGAGT